MRLVPMLIHYVWWHYTTAIADLVRNYLNFFSFLVNFFSLRHVTRNLFAPWKRLGEEYPAGTFQIQAILSAFIINTIMRLVGFVIRATLILVGLIALILSLILFILIILAWLFMPAIIAFLAVLSFNLLFLV